MGSLRKFKFFWLIVRIYIFLSPFINVYYNFIYYLGKNACDDYLLALTTNTTNNNNNKEEDCEITQLKTEIQELKFQLEVMQSKITELTNSLSHRRSEEVCSY